MFMAEIRGDEDSLEILRKNFSKLVKLEKGEYFLVFPNHGVDLNEGLEAAKEVLEDILLVSSFKIDGNCNAEIISIQEVKSSGNKGILLHEECNATESISVVRHVENGNGELKCIDSQKSPENLGQYVVCINKNGDIKKVLEYFREKDESNLAFKLYKILEVIGEDLGSKKDIPKQFNCISGKKFNNLTYTLNNGMDEKSRHHEESPIESKILSEEESKVLMKDIIDEWISMKCK